MTIQELRKELGLTQKAFAEEFGINLRTFQDWELGRTKPPVYLVPLLLRLIKAENIELN